MRVIINRDDVDFGVAQETSGTQEFELSRTGEVQELAVVCFFFSFSPPFRTGFTPSMLVDYGS